MTYAERGSRPADPSGAAPVDESLAALSNALWEVRELLDVVSYQLTVQRLLAEAGEVRWLGYGAQQLEIATEQIGRTEIVRAAHADTVAEGLGLPAGTTLDRLAAAAPAPWDGLLADHADALRTAAGAVTAARTATEHALRAGAAAVDAALRGLEQRIGSAADGTTGEDTGSFGRTAGGRDTAGRRRRQGASGVRLDYRA